ncbi:MAG: membrane dipeptidase [Pseudomonadota bacterium]
MMLSRLLIFALLPAALSAQAESPPSPVAEIHKRSLVLDAHADIATPDRARYLLADGRSRVSPELLKSGQVDAVVMTISVDGPGDRSATDYQAARLQADAELAEVERLISASDGQIVLATSAQAVLDAHEGGKTSFILALQNARILGTDLNAIDEFYAAGVRVFALTHLGHNAWADSSRRKFDGSSQSYEAEAEHGGLSELGRKAVKRINDLGAVVDISQLSKPAALEVMRLSTTPVIASHSNVQQLSQVQRNLSNEEIDLIGATGGVVHIAPFKGYLLDFSKPELISNLKRVRREAGIQENYDYPYELYWELETEAEKMAFIAQVNEVLGEATLDHFLDHIDYVVDRIGIDHVGIGTDFNHGSRIVGFEDASQAINVTDGLISRGYTPEQIEKIWGMNFIRVLRQAVNYNPPSDS